MIGCVHERPTTFLTLSLSLLMLSLSHGGVLGGSKEAWEGILNKDLGLDQGVILKVRVISL